MIWPLFRFLGRNLSNFLVFFWKIEKHQKDILKLSDLQYVKVEENKIKLILKPR